MSLIKCSTCEVKKTEDNYERKSDGSLKKSCIRCLEVKKIYREKSKCIHQRRKGRCKECDKLDSDLIRCSTCDVKKSKDAFDLR